MSEDPGSRIRGSYRALRKIVAKGLVCLPVVALMISGTACDRRSSGRMPEELYFQRLLGAWGLSGWSAESDPEVGEGLEGLTELVDGAADLLWQRGLYRAVFQVYRESGTGGSLEFLRYFFHAGTQARDFWDESCPHGAAGPASSSAQTSSCVRETESMSQVFLLMNQEVLEVRVYGERQARNDLIRRLVSGPGRTDPK